MAKKQKLNTSANRARLPRGRRVIDILAPGIALIYRRGKASHSDGTWAVRTRVRNLPGDGPSPYELSSIGLADDLTEADGARWLTYKQAVERALHKPREMDRDAKAAPLSRRQACTPTSSVAGREEPAARRRTRPRSPSISARWLTSASPVWNTACCWPSAQSAEKRLSQLRAALNATPADIRPNSVVLSALKEHKPQTKREPSRPSCPTPRSTPWSPGRAGMIGSSACRRDARFDRLPSEPSRTVPRRRPARARVHVGRAGIA